MDLRADLAFPASPDEVVAMLRDPDYVRLRAARTGGSDITVDVRDEGDAVVITSERTLPTDRFPAIARKLVGEGLRIRQVDRWRPAGDGSWVGASEVRAVAAPARVSGRMAMTANGAGSRETVEATVTASVPFVGGKLEQLMTDQVLKALKTEERVAAQWLARRSR
jgi:Protein of unknown function (DUF2505)